VRIFRHQAIPLSAEIAPLFELYEEIIVKFPLTYGDKLLLFSKQVNGVNKVFRGRKNLLCLSAKTVPPFELHKEITVKFPLTYGDKLFLFLKEVNKAEGVFEGRKNLPVVYQSPIFFQR